MSWPSAAGRCATSIIGRTCKAMAAKNPLLARQSDRYGDHPPAFSVAGRTTPRRYVSAPAVLRTAGITTMDEVNRFLADVFIPAHNDLFGKAPAAIPVPSCPRRAGKLCHEPRRLVHAGDRSMVAVARPRQPFPSARFSPCSDRPCAWLRSRWLTRPFNAAPSNSR